MSVEFTLENVMNIIAQTFFGGNGTLAGLCIMMVCFFIIVVIMGRLRTSPTYAVIPMIPLAIIFGSLGIMDPTVAVLIVIITTIITAAHARNLVEGK